MHTSCWVSTSHAPVTQMCPRDYTPTLLRWVDKENLPTFLGGTSNATLLDDAGPWNNRDIIAEVEEEHRRAAHLVSDDDVSTTSDVDERARASQRRIGLTSDGGLRQVVGCASSQEKGAICVALVGQPT